MEKIKKTKSIEVEYDELLSNYYVSDPSSNDEKECISVEGIDNKELDIFTYDQSDIQNNADIIQDQFHKSNISASCVNDTTEGISSCDDTSNDVSGNVVLESTNSVHLSYTNVKDNLLNLRGSNRETSKNIISRSFVQRCDFSYEKCKMDDLMSKDVIKKKIHNEKFNLNEEAELKPFNEEELICLYYNQELQESEIMINDFIENEIKSNRIVQHKLYTLLTNYLISRDNLCRSTLRFESLTRDYKKFQDELWQLETTSITEYDECQDGNAVSATHFYKIAHFSQCAFSNLSHVIEDLQSFTNESYILSMFNIQLYKINLECYIQTLCSYFSYLPHNAPISLNNELPHCGSLGPDYRRVVSELKDAISVLFTFQRRPIKDDEFISETRTWLEKLLGVLLRIASARDHIFILNHILRCPSGVGKWASCYIQPPVLPCGSSYNQQYLDHFITTLALLLSPIRERELFLQPMENSLEENGMWVIVDSDVEDSIDDSASKSPLKEKDIIAFLDQIPFADIYRQILFINRRNDEDIYEANNITDRDILRAFSASTLLVNLLQKGIANYNTSVYKQFSKRLSRLIKHTAHYITDHWQIFTEMYSQRCIMDGSILMRLETEYDAFLLRVAYSLYSTSNRIGWQYLATVPFNMVTSKTLWRLYQYLLCTSSESSVVNSEEFVDRIEQLPDDDIYYFLTTITNMALDRTLRDYMFMQTVICQLFQVGFVNTVIRDKCTKSCRILLANLTNKFPSLISDIMLILKKDFPLIGKLSLYLVKELPLSRWKPNQVDIGMLSDWLLSNPLQSWESTLARYIISQLNWSAEFNENELFLPREMHCQIAMIVIRVVMLYAEDVVNSYGVPQGVSQIVRSYQTPEQILTNWAWKILSKLRIHLMDQPFYLVSTSLMYNHLLSQIPDLNSDYQDMDILSNGITRCQSVACYVALLMTNVGHSVPLICDNGFKYCNTLLSTYKYSQVLHIIQLITPFILDSLESLISSESFRTVIVSLLSADRTYMMKISKNYLTAEFPGMVLSQFASLIEYQLSNYSRYSLQNGNSIAKFWLTILCSVWNEDCNSVVYLMNRILSIAFFDNLMKPVAVEILSNFTTEFSNNSNSSTSTGISSLFGWVSSSSDNKTLITSIPVTLLPHKLSKITHSPYFAYFGLDLEEYHTQNTTKLWETLLKELSSCTGRTNIDSSLKKVCSSLKLTPISSSSLSIYRWSQFALDLSVDHPLLAIFWQRFFHLYFQKIEKSSSRSSVGAKFFEGSINSNYQRKLKTKLQQCLEYYSKKSSDNDAEKNWLSDMETIYRTFLLWLEDTQLHDPVLYLPSLPTQYNPHKLSKIINGDNSPWLEYIDFKEIRAIQQEHLLEWNKVLYRDNVLSSSNYLSSSSQSENANPSKRILDRLQSYDAAVLPPPLVITHPIVSAVPREMLVNKNMMMNYLDEYFQILTQHTRSYKIEWNDQESTCKKLLEVFSQLYAKVETEVKLYAACDKDTSRWKTHLKCAGPALIRMRACEAKKDEAVEHKIEKLNKEYQRLLKHNIRSPPFRLIASCIILEECAETLHKEVAEVKQIGDQMILSSLFDVGVSLFYKLVSIYNTEAASYFPTKHLIEKVIHALGEVFINNNPNECSRLLSILIVNPLLTELLLPHFTPSAVTSSIFIQLYGSVVIKLPALTPILVLKIIEKFQINNWLNSKKPRLTERSQFIEVLSTALKEFGIHPNENLLQVHKILRNHLCQLLLHEFPEHYGEILHIILKYSEQEKFSCDIWFDVLNTLVISASCSGSYNANDAPLKEGLTTVQIRDIARKYASEQRVLTFQELVETANILWNNFFKERRRYGLYGLYPKYKNYMSPLLALHSIIGHACIASMLQLQRGTLADKICEQIWPIILNLFSPWIVPYFTAQLCEPSDAWISRLSEDRSVFLPWVTEDIPIAAKMVASCTECIKFVLEALPASNVLLQIVSRWYITNYAHLSIKDHILHTVHSNLLTLPWSRFQPGPTELEDMLKVIDQYLPLCHSYLGSVFMEIQWHIVAYKDVTSSYGVRFHTAFLHLIIKLANEPHLRQAGKINLLLMEAQHYTWHLVDAANYEHILNWFVKNYDPRVVLLVADEDWNAIDVAAFDLLQVAAGYVSGIISGHETSTTKRRIFVRACVKMILNVANRYKTVLVSHHSHLLSSLERMLDKMESVMSSVPIDSRVFECKDLLNELLVLVNHGSGNVLTKLTVKSILNWLKHRAGTSVVLQGLLSTVGETVNDPEQLGMILEACISAWFNNSAGMEEFDWDKILSVMCPINPTIYLSVEQCLLTNSKVLTLYAVTCKLLQTDPFKFNLTKLMNWIIQLKPSIEIESKLPLLWSLAFRQCENYKDEVFSCMVKFAAYLQQLTQLKQGWGLLGVIGLNKQVVPSLKCKLLCLATNAFVLAKLIAEKVNLERESTTPEEDSDVIAGIANITMNTKPTGSELMKAIYLLSSLLNDKHYIEYKVTIELAIDLIKSNDINLYKGEQFVITLAKQLYTDGFIHAFPSNNFLSI